MDDKPAKKPWIGFLGMLLIAMAMCAAFIEMNAIAFVFLVTGAGALIWALFTGNLKFWG